MWMSPLPNARSREVMRCFPDLYRITLAPSGVDKHNYVVMDDEYLNPTKYRPGLGGVAIYYRDNGRKPQCFG